MLGFWQSHSSYQKSLEKFLISNFPIHKGRVLYFSNLIHKVWILDLDPLKDIICQCYRPFGRPAHYQEKIIRSLIVMTHLKIHSISEFVSLIKSDRLFAAICGFFDDYTPGVGNFYDFIDRLWGQDVQFHLSKPLTKPRKPKKGEKLPTKHPGVVNKLVDHVLSGKQLKQPSEAILQKIFAQLAVIPSANLGLLGDLKNINISGDGAPLETGASIYGKKLCDCRKNKIYKCDCPRYYPDRWANWGYDSYHDRYFYGYTLYHITASNSPNDLPIYLRLVQGSRHDSVTSVFAFTELLQLYPQFKFQYATLDSAHDVQGIYQMFNHFGIKPLIDLNKRRTGKRIYSAPVKIDENGMPICPAELPMVYWGFEKKRSRLKWRCPCYKNISECPLDKPCSPAPYGRSIYTKPNWDLRLFTTPPRKSKKWKELFKERTSVERSLKRTLVDYKVESARVRSKKHWFFRITLTAINHHMDAQINVTECEVLNILNSLNQTA